MYQVVEQEIQMSKRRSSECSLGGSSHGGLSGPRAAALSLLHELVLTEPIGAGGFGTVWRGTWKKVTAAVKVC
jgi:hypothetical protein